MTEKTRSNEQVQGRIMDMIRLAARVAHSMGMPTSLPVSDESGSAYVEACAIKAVKDKYPEIFANTSRCGNCGASMNAYWYTFDCLDAALLVAIGGEVLRESRRGTIFADANKVHIDRLPVATSIKKRMTQCAKLGLIAQNDKRSGWWVITKRGFAALKGIPVPKKVKVFRNEIIDRTEEMITIAEAVHLYTERVDTAMARGKPTKSDYRAVFYAYDPKIWVEFAEVQPQRLF
jgi:hypothetical protein